MLRSESVIVCTDPDPSINMKKFRKILISTVLCLFNYLIFEYRYWVKCTYLRYVIKKITWEKKLCYFLGILTVTEEKSRIWIRIRIRISIKTSCIRNTDFR